MALAWASSSRSPSGLAWLHSSSSASSTTTTGAPRNHQSSVLGNTSNNVGPCDAVCSVGKIWGPPVDQPNAPSCRSPYTSTYTRQGDRAGADAYEFRLQTDLNEKSIFDSLSDNLISRDGICISAPQKRRNRDATVDSPRRDFRIRCSQSVLVVEFQVRQPLRLTGTSMLEARISNLT